MLSSALSYGLSGCLSHRPTASFHGYFGGVPKSFLVYGAV